MLGVVHNVTSATRLLDVLPLVATDPRVEVAVTCTNSSPFTADVDPYLAAHGFRTVPWDEPGHADLAIAASHGRLHELGTPLVVLPHGTGYNKFLNGSVFGMEPASLLHNGRVIASSLVFSHDEQLDRLRRSCPEALGAAVVAGDPCFDRMLASRPLRHTYRDAAGVRPDQKLVFVSSTWGPSSLFDATPDLVRTLRAELPLDEYAIAIALHPNVQALHSRWQVERWLDACLRAGVALIPRAEGWRAGLVSADLVVGDHGSVTFYGAALGTPTLLATWPHDRLDPGSPVGRFVAAADRLDRSTPLEPQVRAALHDQRTHDDITGLTTSVPGSSARLLRTELYRLLDLPEPADAAPTHAVPLPQWRVRPPTVEAVRIEYTVSDNSLNGTVVRHATDPRPLPAHTYLVVSTDEPTATALELADAVVHARPGDAHAWITGTLAALPGAMVATAPIDDTTWLVGTRTGCIAFTSPDGDGRVWAPLVLAWLERHPLEDFPHRVWLQSSRSWRAFAAQI
ncbi:hypothetical protein Lesp02_41400 [Lentzea sp. NBRC 105346]|nr:hypothetical protein Lesp02_41400 [Lentzea sp. NBRC 105346]